MLFTAAAERTSAGEIRACTRHGPRTVPRVWILSGSVQALAMRDVCRDSSLRDLPLDVLGRDASISGADRMSVGQSHE